MAAGAGIDTGAGVGANAGGDAGVLGCGESAAFLGTNTCEETAAAAGVLRLSTGHSRTAKPGAEGTFAAATPAAPKVRVPLG